MTSGGREKGGKEGKVSFELASMDVVRFVPPPPPPTKEGRRVWMNELTFKEKLENTSGLLVDQSRDSLDSSSSRQSSDRRLGDTLHESKEKREKEVSI